MLKKSISLFIGSIVFIIGMILFPLPIPFGFLIMVIGLSMMLSASPKLQRNVVKQVNKHHYSLSMWRKIRNMQRQRRQQNKYR